MRRKELECMSMLTCNVQLLIDALSEKNEEKSFFAYTNATDQLKAVSTMMAEFDKACTSPTTKLWLKYMDMVMILKRYIHAERAGLWEEHLTEVAKMSPYLVAAGHYKYVSCLPYYLEAMRSLSTLAQTYSRHSKMDSVLYVRQGVDSMVSGQIWNLRKLTTVMQTKLFTGISQQPAAIEKYLRALPVLTAVSEQTKVMAHLNLDDQKHHEDSNNSATKEAESVMKITEVVDNRMINPFKCNEQKLMNISTGYKAESADLVNAREKGLKALVTAK